MQQWREQISAVEPFVSRFTRPEGVKRIKHRRWQPLLHASPTENPFHSVVVSLHLSTVFRRLVVARATGPQRTMNIGYSR